MLASLPLHQPLGRKEPPGVGVGDNLPRPAGAPVLTAFPTLSLYDRCPEWLPASPTFLVSVTSTSLQHRPKATRCDTGSVPSQVGPWIRDSRHCQGDAPGRAPGEHGHPYLPGPSSSRHRTLHEAETQGGSHSRQSPHPRGSPLRLPQDRCVTGARTNSCHCQTQTPPFQDPGRGGSELGGR